ncbi:pheromone processing endoprotease [Mactra antiquata]
MFGSLALMCICFILTSSEGPPTSLYNADTSNTNYDELFYYYDGTLYDPYGYDLSDVQSTTQVLVKYVGVDSDALKTLMYGFGYLDFSEVFTNFYLFTKDDATQQQTSFTLQLLDSDVLSISDVVLLPRSLRTTNNFMANDQYYILQWNLRATSPATPPPMNVLDVWSRGYTGKSIVVAVIDNGIDASHVDLTDNYDSSLSYNYLDNNNNVMHGSDSHGTKCAGVIGAAKNSHCMVGVAFDATIAAVKFIGNALMSSPVVEAASLIHRLDVVDIYTCSWGPNDDGRSLSRVDLSHDIHNAALLKGVMEGRNGKGAIYVWAAGNGLKNIDDCIMDGFIRNPYTIAVTSLKNDGTPDDDVESCAMIMAAVYSSSVPTLSPGSQCEFDFAGSSAAATTAAGIIALVLEANGNLTWRDVRYLIVETSVPVYDLPDSEFTQNGAGKWVSPIYGFGIMDAEAMVDAALTWQTVEPQISHYEPMDVVDLTAAGFEDIVSTHTLTDCPVKTIEYVVVFIRLEAVWREYTSIYLISPFKTTSRLLRERKLDSDFSALTWYFSSLAFWGEDPNGVWTLTINSSLAHNGIYLSLWQMAFSGTRVEGAKVTSDSGQYTLLRSTLETREISETDLPIIVGASIGAALGFIILTASCIFIIRTVVEQMTHDTIETIETIQEESPPAYSE